MIKLAGRYLIMGTQIGMLEALIKHKKYDEALKEIDVIFKKQFIGNSTNHIEDDVRIFDGFSQLINKIKKI